MRKHTTWQASVLVWHNLILVSPAFIWNERNPKINELTQKPMIEIALKDSVCSWPSPQTVLGSPLPPPLPLLCQGSLFTLPVHT